MKKLQHYLISSLAASLTVISLSSGLTSCVDLNVQPPLDTSNALALSTADGLQNGLNGAYALLRGGSLYGGNLYGATEILADQVVVGGGGFGQLEIARRGMTFFNPEGRGIWQDGYNAVNRVNNVIDAAPKVTTTDANRNRILGECYAIRAMAHFEIVRLFAQPWGTTTDNSHRGIPIRVEPTRGAANARLRPATVAQVYTQIVNDLNFAITNLPEDNPNKISRSTARAFLARVLLQREDYAGAFSAADAVVQSNKYQLNSNVRNVFDNAFTSESILEFVSNQPVEDASGGVQGYFRQDEGLSPVLSLDEGTVRAIRANSSDKRGDTSMISSVDGLFFTKKFQKIFMNMPALRYSEILLVRAEAAARTNNVAAALASVNQVRQRAGLAALTNLTGDALLNAILTERATELAFEGHRIHDLKRLRRSISNAYLPMDAALPWNSPRLVLQIPDVERNGTPADFWN
jgi:starch-binding outer membrane protein, SusD/RagB family